MDSMDIRNNKILFIIDTYWQYDNYVKTQALQEVKDKVYFIANPELSHLDFNISPERLIFYSYPNKKDILHRHIFNINSWRLRKKDIVFRQRSLLFKPRQVFFYRILALPVIYQITKFIFLKRGEDRNLSEFIQKINPSIILIPSHAFEGSTFETIRLARKMKIPTLMIIDNWDTLANKTIFTFKPDFLGVWSQQQVEDAFRIKGMPKERTFILGAPKFTKYLKAGNSHPPSPYPFKYVLYIGIAEVFNELGALKILDEEIEKRNLDLKIVFRPHITQHARRCPDVFFEYDFKHVVLDTPARRYYKRSVYWDISSESVNPIYYPDHSYYLPLLSNMEFMISPQTTMILEASLANKRHYILSYDDGIHRFGPKFIFDNCRFLFGVERLPNVRMVRKLEDLRKIFDPSDPLKEEVEPLDVDYFISKENSANYSENLKKVIDTILTK